MPRLALDASALLAYLQNEPGADAVAEAIAAGATISTVNLAEALSTLAMLGLAPRRAFTELTERGILGGAVSVEPFQVADAIEAARLRPLTIEAGLSLGDRACIAQAARLGAEVVTADRAWAGLELPVRVRQIREPRGQ